MNANRARTIAYWTTTAFLAFQFAMGGVFSILQPPVVLEGMRHLGYPAYLPVLLGTWKGLGALALLAPRFPRLKEWAYAGIVFDLTGAAWSHASSGDGASAVASPLAFLALATASYLLRPQSRTLGSVIPARAPSGASVREAAEAA